MMTFAFALALFVQDNNYPTVPAPDAGALEKLNQAGAVAMPLAANTNVVSVNFGLAGGKIGDAALADLKPLTEQLVWLSLAGTSVTDAGLAALKEFKNLQILHLEKTSIGDEGLAHLKGLTELRYLNLYGTKVTDKGLEHLKGLAKLKNLYVWQTSVTEAGAGALGKAIPAVNVNLGVEAPAPEAPKKDEKKADAKPINAKCPLSGKDVDASQTATHEGQLIAFCCGNCKGKFEKEPAKYLDKVENFKKKAEKKDEKKADAKPINAKCPLSGKDVDAAQAFEYKKQLIAFCCGNCKGKFEKEPEKFVGKVAEFKN